MRNSALNHQSWRRLTALSAVLALTGGLVSGCGKDSAETPSAGEVSASPAATPTSLPTPSPTPSAKPTPTRKPTKPPKPAEGSGDSEGDDEPAAAGGGICVELSEAEIGTVLGGEVAGSAIPGGGCLFSQQLPDPPAATFTDVPFADMVGGMSGAKENATSSVEGTPQDVAGIGDAAFVVTGTSFGGSETQGAGAVRVGDRLISVNLAQTSGLKARSVRSIVLELLRLAASSVG